MGCGGCGEFRIQWRGSAAGAVRARAEGAPGGGGAWLWYPPSAIESAPWRLRYLLRSLAERDLDLHLVTLRTGRTPACSVLMGWWWCVVQPGAAQTVIMWVGWYETAALSVELSNERFQLVYVSVSVTLTAKSFQDLVARRT